MGIEKFGTDAVELNTGTGGIVSADGLTLIDTGSSGEASILLGPAVLREVQAGVANGTWAALPPDPDAAITTDNPLPYWSWSPGTGISAAIVYDTTAASNSVLRFTVASGTLSGNSGTLTRFIPVASSASRSFSYYAEASLFKGTASTQATVKVTCQFYKADQTTTTGTAFTSATFTFSDLQGTSGVGISAPNLYEYIGTPSLANTTAPADAAYLKITITIATVATQSADRTVDLTEVRLAHGLPELLLTDKNAPATRNPARITNQDAVLAIYDGSGNSKLYLSNISGIAAGITTTQSIALTSGGTLDISAPTGVSISNGAGADGSLTLGSTSTSGDLSLNVGGSDVILRDTASGGTNPRLLFRDAAGTYYTGLKAGAANVMQVLSGTSATTYGQLWAARIYPMNGSTASRYIFDDGTNTAFSGSVLTGTLTSTGVVTGNNFTADTITGTTATTNAAIWVLTSGTTYNLRRNTSSARYKTDITDADAAVLEAAKRVKARHYASTIEDEAGATRLGFIAEEVYDAGLTHAVGLDAEGRPETLDSTALIAALFVRIEDLEKRLAALEG
jgi:hypothetical protein